MWHVVYKTTSLEERLNMAKGRMKVHLSGKKSASYCHLFPVICQVYCGKFRKILYKQCLAMGVKQL